MHHVYSSVEQGGLSKNDVLRTYFVVSARVFASVEPCEIHKVAPVGEMGDDALTARSHIKSLETENPASYLHKRHLGVHLLNRV